MWFTGKIFKGLRLIVFMNKKRVFGLFLVLSGIVVMFSQPISSVTGFVVLSSVYSSLGSWVFILGLGMMIGGIGMVVDTPLEVRVKEIGRVTKQQKGESFSQRYRNGIQKLRDFTAGIYTLSKKTEDIGLKQNYLSKLDRVIDALKNRKEYFYDVPFHEIDWTKDNKERAGKLKDLPDWGVYDYRPLKTIQEANPQENRRFLRGKSGKATGTVDLTLVHYTDDTPYREIKNALESGTSKHSAHFFTDENGYSFFLDTLLPEGLSTKQARTLLGTTFQQGLGKESNRNPQTYIQLKVRVPAERILTKYENGIRKYAIAGGIDYKDIVPNSVSGGKYRRKNLGPQSIEKWNV